MAPGVTGGLKGFGMKKAVDESMHNESLKSSEGIVKKIDNMNLSQKEQLQDVFADRKEKEKEDVDM